MLDIVLLLEDFRYSGVDIVKELVKVHPEYLPTTLDGKLTHIAEECAEIILMVCKIQRFGLHNINPKNPAQGSNLDRLNAEIADFDGAVDRFRNELYREDSCAPLEDLLG